MAPKKKEYSFDMWKTVIHHYLNDDREHKIATKMLIPRPSINSIITKSKKTKGIGNILGRGRKRKTSANVGRIIQHRVKANRRKSAPSVKVEFQSEREMTISEQTVRRRLHEVGLFDRVARKKPYVNKVNHGKRIAFVKTYREKPPGFWNNVLWSHESKFSLFGSNEKVIVWRMAKGELDSKCTLPTVKHAGGNVNCWDCFSIAGIALWFSSVEI